MRGLPDGIGCMVYHSGTRIEGEWELGKIKKEYRRNFKFSIFKCQYTIYCKDGQDEFTKIVKIDHSDNVYIKQTSNKA